MSPFQYLLSWHFLLCFGRIYQPTATLCLALKDGPYLVKLSLGLVLVHNIMWSRESITLVAAT